MTDAARAAEGKDYPLQAWMHRPMDRRMDIMKCLPELHVIVGRDNRSSGVNIYAWQPTGGTHPHYETIFDARWASPIGSTQEALRIAADAVAAALAALLMPDAD
jgi:hypothetical protein